jgi:chemotaxis family two-component system response regulator Rcp1
MTHRGRHRHLEILLVEDNLGDVRLVQEALRDTAVPCRLNVTRDGEEAWRFLTASCQHGTAPRPDIVLLDLNLPRKDGRELLAQIKGHPSLRLIPVLVLTTSNSEEDIKTSYSLHASCYIVKPMDLAEYRGMMKAVEGFWMTRVALPPAETGGRAR